MSDASAPIDWHQYFTDFRAKYQPPEEELTPEEAEKKAQEEAKFTLIQDWRDIALEKMPSGAKLVIEWLGMAGFQIKLGHTRTHHPDQYYKSDSTKKDSEGQPVNAKGSFKKAAWDVDHYWVKAALRVKGQLVAVLSARWEGGSFKGSRIWDVYGTPVEFYFDYTPPLRGSDLNKAIAAKANNEYNDGALFLQKDQWLLTERAFKEWLNDWGGILGIELLAIRKAAVRKTAEEKQEEANLLAIVNGKEWTG